MNDIHGRGHEIVIMSECGQFHASLDVEGSLYQRDVPFSFGSNFTADHTNTNTQHQISFNTPSTLPQNASEHHGTQPHPSRNILRR